MRKNLERVLNAEVSIDLTEHKDFLTISKQLKNELDPKVMSHPEF